MITGMPRIAIAVHDFQAVVSLFRDKFGMPVIDLSKESIPEYGAALGMCVPEGGSNIELMSPVDPNTPLSKSLQGFLDRRGEGLFALMLEAPVPDDEAVVLANRGLNVMPLMPGAFGRDVHPSSTHGVLIRVYPVNSFVAVEVYGTQFNMAMEATEIDVERGVYTAICRPEEGGVIELVAVDDSSRPFAKAVAEFLQKKREGMYALVLHASDISATQKMLVDRGLKVRACADSPGVLEVDQEATFGALLRIEAG